jgi:glycosyltransferase involved in cell wall biosynthesis
MEKQLRVLIIRNAYQKDAGGAEQYALNLAIALKKSGHRPILVTKVRKIQEKSRPAGVKCVTGPWHNTQKWDRLYYLRYPLFTLWYVWAILRYRIDVVHPQSRDDFVFATRAAQLLHKPVIWTEHADLKYVLDNVNHYNPRMRGWVVRASRYAKEIICVSGHEQKEIEAVAPELQTLRIVPGGVFAPEKVKPVEKTNKIIIGTNARLVKDKGIGELLEAFATLNRSDCDLWLLGGFSGNWEHYAGVAQALGIADRVRFIDYVPNPNDYVASMDIFVLASYHEAFGLAIVEAAMLARPIIASAVGGIPEIIDDSCGVLVPPKDANALAAALRDLLADEAKRQQLGNEARQKAKAQFDFQKIVDGTIVPMYFQALGGEKL